MASFFFLILLLIRPVFGTGYLDLHPQSKAFKGNIKFKKAPKDENWKTPSHILSKYFKGQYFQSEKLEELISSLIKKRESISLSLCLKTIPLDRKKCLKGNLEPIFKKSLSLNRDFLAIQSALKFFKRARDEGQSIKAKDLNTPSASKFLSYFFSGLELFWAIKRDNLGLLNKKRPSLFNDFGRFGLSTKITSRKMEALNLPGLGPNIYYSPEEIERLKRKNVDLSKLSPFSGKLWKNSAKKISTLSLGPDLHEDYLRKFLPEEVIPGLTMPNKLIHVTIDEELLLQGNYPQLIVHFGEEKWLLKFPVSIHGPQKNIDLASFQKNISEFNLINSNPIALTMAKALGFNVEPSFFKKKVHLFFKGQAKFLKSHHHLLNRLDKKFPLKNYKTPFLKYHYDALKSRYYYELKGVTLQRIDPKKIGTTRPLSLGKTLLREFKGLAVFLAWIDDIGVENLDVMLDGSFKISNLGLALGKGYPNLFGHKMVKSVRKNSLGTPLSLKLKFRSLNSRQWFQTISPSDAKWMVKRLALFSPTQLEKGFIASGFPPAIAKIYTQKLMSRRNQLLSALNLLGEKVNGQFLKQETPWKGKLEGLEHLFNNNGELVDREHHLNDNKGEQFLINWSLGHSSLRYKALKNLSSTLLNSGLELILKSAHLGLGFTNKEFRWRELHLNTQTYGPLCDGNCYFQGIKAGVTALLPQRIIISNPDKHSSKKFLALDFFRIAVEGHLGGNIKDIFHVNPLSLKTGGSFGGFYVFEFIRVRPLEEINFKDDIKSLFKLPLISFHHFQKDMIEAMKEGDSLIISSYLGLQSSLLTGLNVTSLASIAGILSTQFIVTGRLFLQKQDQENFLANWGILKDAEINTILKLNALGLIGTNWFEGKLSKARTIEEIYQLDISNPQEKNYLLDNTTLLRPKNIPQKYKMYKREEKETRTSFFIGPSRKLSFNFLKRFKEIKLYDYLENRPIKRTEFMKLKSRRYQGEITETYQAFLDDNNQTSVKITYSIDLEDLDRKRLARLFPSIENILGVTFIPYDLNLIDQNLGPVQFIGKLLLSNQAVKKILNLEEEDLCQVYLKIQDREADLDRCFKRKYDLALFSFLSDFKQLQERSFKLNGKWKRLRSYQFLKHFLDLFFRYSKKRSTAKIFKQFLAEEDYYEMAFLLSAKNPFPGQTSRILLTSPNKNNFTPSIIEMADSRSQVFALFSDKIIQAIGPYFYKKHPLPFHKFPDDLFDKILGRLKFSY